MPLSRFYIQELSFFANYKKGLALWHYPNRTLLVPYGLAPLPDCLTVRLFVGSQSPRF